MSLAKTFSIIVTGLFVAVAANAQAPSVDSGGVVNVASYAFADLPGGSIAQGSIFGIFGKNLGPTPYISASTFPLPTALGNTTVKVTSGGVTVNAILFLTSAGQINALLPSSVPVGDATLTVTTPAGTSAPAAFKIVANSFGVFTLNSSGNGPGAITDAKGATFGSLTAANPDQTVILYGTGLGPVKGDEAGGALPGNMANIPVEIFVGSQKATVTYAGRSGCCSGLDQLVFNVPSVPGCHVPIVVKINNVVSNSSTIAVAPKGSRTCSDPGAPTPDELAQYQAKGNINIGTVVLAHTAESLTVPILGKINASVDAGVGIFQRYNATLLDIADNPFNTYTVGTCTVSFFKGSAAGPAETTTITLDAGSALTVSGPAGSKQLPKTNIGGFISYNGALSDVNAALSGGGGFLNPGAFTVTGPGGSGANAVGAFTANITVATPLTWTNMDAISNVVRANGQLITWSGGDPNSLILITGYSVNGSAPTSSGAEFVCYANPADGQFTIPSTVLLPLPVSQVANGTPTGGLLVGSTSLPKKFTAPGLDLGYVISTSDTVKNLNYQ